MSPRVKAILEAVAMAHGLRAGDLTGPNRRRAVAYARFQAMASLRAILTFDGKHVFSLPTIGEIFNRDHTSVLSGLRRAAKVGIEPIQQLGEINAAFDRLSSGWLDGEARAAVERAAIFHERAAAKARALLDAAAQSRAAARTVLAQSGPRAFMHGELV